MNLALEDRIALSLGRLIMRNESLQAQLDGTRADLAALQAERLTDEQVDVAADGKTDLPT